MQTAVTVMGAGPMGAAVVQRLTAVGVAVTVWNRTWSKAAALQETGARAEPDAAAAIEASPICLVSLRDYAVADRLFDAPIRGDRLAGRTVVQLSTGTPAEAERFTGRLDGSGCAVVAGAVFGTPGTVRAGAAMVLVGGTDGGLRSSRETLQHLGTVVHAGPSPRAACVLDAAILNFWYATAISFAFSVGMCQREGISPELLRGAGSAAVPPTLDWLLAAASEAGGGAVNCTNETHAAAVRAITRTAEELAMPAAHLQAYGSYLDDAVRGGLAGLDLPALLHQFRGATGG